MRKLYLVAYEGKNRTTAIPLFDPFI